MISGDMVCRMMFAGDCLDVQVKDANEGDGQVFILLLCPLGRLSYPRLRKYPSPDLQSGSYAKRPPTSTHIPLTRFPSLGSTQKCRSRGSESQAFNERLSRCLCWIGSFIRASDGLCGVCTPPPLGISCPAKSNYTQREGLPQGRINPLTLHQQSDLTLLAFREG